MSGDGGPTARLRVWAPDGAPEVGEDDDLAVLVVDLVGEGGLRDGDVVVVTSKVVAKAEGRVRPGGRDEAVADETVRVVARRGPTTIARTRHGLTLAAAGVDASNVPEGHVVLLPVDPDASARDLRRRLRELTECVVGVVVTDTAGRAWREGQTDIAVGAAGLVVAESFAGRVDAHGNPLVVTAPAVADEIAGAAELAQGKLAGRPFAVVRGRPDLVLAADDDGPGAAALVRPDGADLFGLGAREAVLRALVRDPAAAVGFGAPATVAEMGDVLEALLGVRPAAPEGADAPDAGLVVELGDPRAHWTLEVAAYACGWSVDLPQDGSSVRLRPSPALP